MTKLEKKNMKRGDIYNTKNGDLEIRVVISANEVVVRFVDTDYFTITTKSNICSGKIKDLMKPSVFGIGFMGAGKYNINNAPTAYQKWTSMLQRCYRENSISWERYGGNGVTVAEEWHNFQNFAEWYESYKYKEDGWHLDKDILIKGNKLYCKESCCIVPRIINQSLVSRVGLRGEYAIGVTWDEKASRYSVMLNAHHTHYKAFRQMYRSEREAFMEYKAAKESYLVALAYEWRGRVAPKVLKALVEYEVEWND